MVRLLLVIRADRGVNRERSGNCSSIATADAVGSSYKRTGEHRTEGKHDLDRVLPLGGMPPKGKAVAPTLVGNQAADYHELKIQGQPLRLPLFSPVASGALALQFSSTGTATDKSRPFPYRAS